MIIDALNECEDKDSVLKLIEIITGVFQAEGTFPLQFFFTSRLEGHIVSGFAKSATMQKTSQLALDETEDNKMARLSPRELVRRMIHFSSL